MKKAFAVELEVPDNFTDAELQLVFDALARVDRYVPGGVKVVNVLPFEAWTGTPNDPNQTDPTPPSVTPTEPFAQQVPSGTPVRVTTAALPADQVPREIPPVQAADESGIVSLFPKGLQPTVSPATKPEPSSGVPTITQLKLRRDILAAMSKGAYYAEAAEWFGAILASMPVGQNEVLITADFWQ